MSWLMYNLSIHQVNVIEIGPSDSDLYLIFVATHFFLKTHHSLLTGLTVDLGEVKTAPTECKEKCFQMSHLPIFTIVKHLNVDNSSKKEVN